MITCPTCNGAKRNAALLCGGGRCTQAVLDCRTCGGTGEVTEEHAARIAEGERLRHDRIARRVSLREEAKRLGISPVELSHREQGRCDG